MIATYEGTYPTRIEAENAAFRLRLMGYKTKLKADKYPGKYQVFSNA